MSYRNPPPEPEIAAATLTWGDITSILYQLALGLLAGLFLLNAIAHATGLPGLVEIVEFLYRTDSDNLVPVVTFFYFQLLGLIGFGALKLGRWMRRTLRLRREPQA